MRIILIDDSADYRQLLAHRIKAMMPNAQVEEYDPIARGRPSPEFYWGDYDALILDYQLGIDNGLDWLMEFRNDPMFPATIVLTGHGDEATAVRALKLGADDYLRKMDLTQTSLKAALENAVQSHKNTNNAAPAGQDVTQPATSGVTAAAASVLQAEVSSGQINIGPYQIGNILGQGGMAMVYQATRLEDGEIVAVKFLEQSDCQDERAISRFMEEFHLLVSLSHPRLVKIYEQGFTDHYGYIVMELLTGGDLKERIYRTDISHDQAIAYMKDVVSALQVLHNEGIVHRDLKPANIMFRKDDDLVLTDFGTAKDMSGDMTLTNKGEVVGTPYYMSPEQIRDHTIDERSDMYSLGVIFHELLTKKRPFTAKSATALMYKHLYTEPPRMDSVSEPINDIAQKLLAKDPGGRYKNAGELLQALDSL